MTDLRDKKNWFDLMLSRASGVGVVFGLILSIAGALLWLGSWKAQEDHVNDDHSRRIQKLEDARDKQMPEFETMKSDLRYLAERARRQDEAAERRAQ